MKKIRGNIYYFGRWAKMVDGVLVRLPWPRAWQEALEIYNAQRDDLFAGRTPRVKTDGLTIKELGNRFWTANVRKHESGELGSRMLQEYKDTIEFVAAAFGAGRLVEDLAADDFEKLRARMAERWGPTRLGNEIQKVRTLFKYGYNSGLMKTEVRYGDGFRKPAKKVMRLHRAQNGKKFFEPSELRDLIEAAGIPLRAMILLGVNCGFGNADCASLSRTALDLEKGIVVFPRPKTGVERRAFLWPETVEALKTAIADRPEPKDKAHSDLVFITKYGHPWSEEGFSGAITLETRKLLTKLGIRRKGLTFYGLRHTFRTVADATRDFPAVRLVMGHADESIDAVYREQIDDSRLKAVAQHVHDWLWKKPEGAQGEEKPDAETAQAEPAAKPGPKRQAKTRKEIPPDGPTLRLFVGEAG